MNGLAFDADLRGKVRIGHVTFGKKFREPHSLTMSPLWYQCQAFGTELVRRLCIPFGDKFLS